MNEDDKNLKDHVYYCALYFNIVHMTIYIAILVLSITIGLLISTSSTTNQIVSSSKCTIVIFALILMFIELYSVYRMYKLGNIIFEGLPKTDIPRLTFIKHGLNQIFCIIASIVVTGLDIWLACKAI